MKNLFSLIAAAFLLSAGLPAVAQTAAAPAAAPAKTAQQTKMGTCNKEAEGKKGDERKAFMKQCLSAKVEAPTQQTKMKTCNVDAKDKKGDERKAFMKECLSK